MKMRRAWKRMVGLRVEGGREKSCLGGRACKITDYWGRECGVVGIGLSFTLESRRAGGVTMTSSIGTRIER